MNQTVYTSNLQALLDAAQAFREQAQPEPIDPELLAAANNLESLEQLVDNAEAMAQRRHVVLCESSLQLARARLAICEARLDERNLKRECKQKENQLLRACSKGDAKAISRAANVLGVTTNRYSAQHKIMTDACETRDNLRAIVNNHARQYEYASNSLKRAQQLLVEARRTYNRVYRANAARGKKRLQLRSNVINAALEFGNVS